MSFGCRIQEKNLLVGIGKQKSLDHGKDILMDGHLDGLGQVKILL